MLSKSIMDEMIRRLVKAYNPLKIYLYGDYAEGAVTEESNVNLFIIVESSEEAVLKRGYLAFDALLGLGIPHNTIVFTKEEFDKYASDPKSTTYEIVTQGRIIYAPAYAQVATADKQGLKIGKKKLQSLTDAIL